MVKKDLLTNRKGIPGMRYALLSLILFLFSNYAISQDQIGCNGHTQVSLDSDCEAIITAEIILKGLLPVSNLSSIVTLSGPGQVTNNGTLSPVVTTPGTYKVTLTSPTGNSCWGVISVEDKLPPKVTTCPCQATDGSACPIVCTDEAAFSANTLVGYTKPTVDENCSTYTTTYLDEVIPTAVCGEKVIKRTWLFKDIYGNVSTPCITYYRITKVNILSGITAPENNLILTCGADVTMPGIFNYYKAKFISENYTTAEATAKAYTYAYPTVNGQPLNNQVCNIMAAKADTEIPVCDQSCSNSKKVIRLWTVIDWCLSGQAGGIITYTQVIEAVDKEAPTVQAHDITLSVDPWSCSGNFLLPAPDLLHDNCSANVTYSVRGPIGVSITFDAPTKRYLVTGAPKGTHQFTYVAKDCCGNEGTTSINVTILDKTPPVAIAKQNIVISLTTSNPNDGIAKLFTNSVDNGSYDSCTPVHIEIRREVDPARDEDGCGYTGNMTYNADGHPNDGSTDPSDTDYDPDNGAYVKFCCADITNRDVAKPYGIVKVWMRVWDDGNMSGVFGDVVDGQSDNYNETWVEVRVEDVLAPVISCPANVTISCNDDATNLTKTGTATAFSNCLTLETIYTDVEDLTCGRGTIIRTWKVKAKPTITCTQIITKQSPNGVFDEDDIDWPRDTTTTCLNSIAIYKPTWTAASCEQVGLSLKSDTFYFESTACMKILNHWTVINWCDYKPNGGGSDGYFTWTQTIKIVDNEKPVLPACPDLMFAVNDDADADADGKKCEVKNLMITKSATDVGNCPSAWLKWTVFVDLWGDGVYDYEFSSFLPSTDSNTNDSNGNGIKDLYVAPTGQGQDVKITIPEDIAGSMSTHKILWKVSDGCGNVTECTQNFMVVDKKKPTPYCLNISSALMQNGQVELWAVDFNVGSYDNCTASSNLLYTFDNANPVLTKLNAVHFFKGAGLNATEAEYTAGNAQKWNPSTKTSGMVFNCADYPSVDVKMTVWDEKLNSDFCVVTLKLADNQGACSNAQSTSVSGKIITNSGKNLTNAEVTMSNGIAEMQKSVSTNTNGEYAFANTIMHYDYTISSTKNNDYLNGVSTLDLVLIQRHVLNLEKLNSPYLIIAADINNDAKVTASDLVELRKLILGIYETLPANDSWRFVSNAQTFLDPTSPWPFVEKISINDLSSEAKNQNFVALKVGDVNGNALANANDVATAPRSNVSLTTEDISVEANKTFTANFAADINQVYGLQFSLTLKNADLLGVYVGGNKLADANIAKVSKNTYTVSWNDVNAINGSEIISIQAVSGADAKLSQIIEMNSSITSAEVYAGDDLQTSKLSLRFAGDESNEVFALYQNEPNPFTDKTNISFYLPQAGNATLKVFDVTGKVIFNSTRSFGKGQNSFILSRNELSNSGIMIYQLESGSNTATKKMIGLE